MNYPRINQYRHLFRAGRRALLALAVGVCGLLLAVMALTACYWLATERSYASAVVALLLVGGMAASLILAAVCILRSAGRPLALAERNRIGAESEDHVTSILRSLCDEGWRCRGSLDWPGVGDIDNALISPGGEVAFAIETKTRSYLLEHMQRVYEQATWLCRRHRCRCGAVAVLVPARARNLERFERGVLVVSPDRLIPALRAAYGAACAATG
jgi:hypothetical protein